MLVPKTEIIVSKDGAEIVRKTVRPGEYVFGREPECDVQVDADLVSGKHAKLTVNYDEWLIEDLGSLTGTLLNGEPVATEARRVWPSQKITLGAFTIELHALAADDLGESLMPTTAAVRKYLPPDFLRDRRYQIGKLVAEGGMGAILEATDQATRRSVAMKVMLRQADQNDLLRFIEEAQVTAQLEHPNIVPVHELSVNEQEQVFYTMKYVRGVTLRKVLEQLAAGDTGAVKKYPLAALLTIFQKVCDAVAFAHSCGVIHRDLKPENIMLGDFGEVLVMDWGLAKLVGNADRPGSATVRSVKQDEGESFSTMAGSIMGTPHYMAPEQAAGDLDAIDPRSDIFALGAILFHLLALRTPVSGASAVEIIEKITHGQITPPVTPPKSEPVQPRHCPGGRIPESLAAVAMKALALAQADRYQSVPELQKELTQYQTGFATRAERAGLRKRLMLLLKRNRHVSLAIVLVTLLFAVGFGVVQFRQFQGRVAEHDRLAKTAEAAAKQDEWDTAIARLSKAQAVLERPDARPRLVTFLVAGAKADIDGKRWGAAAIKLQEVLRIDQGNADAANLMPWALGEGFVSVATPFAGELVELFAGEKPELRTRSHGVLPVKELRLREGVHQFEIHREGRRWCSLPLEIERGGRVKISIPITEIPAGYEYVHEGDFIQGDEGTTQADGFIGKRKRRLAGFFIRSTVVTGAEYFRFRQSPDYARLITEALQADKLTVADIQPGAKSAQDLQVFKDTARNSELLPARALSLYESMAFAKWAGARLPTEEEFEKAARGIDGRIFSAGNESPKLAENWMTQPLSRDRSQVSPYGCWALTDTLWLWTSSRIEPGAPRWVVKGGTGIGLVVDRKPARRKALDPKAKYFLVSALFCKDLPPAP